VVVVFVVRLVVICRICYKGPVDSDHKRVAVVACLTAACVLVAAQACRVMVGVNVAAGVLTSDSLKVQWSTRV
jgi:hypothetical protein